MSASKQLRLSSQPSGSEFDMSASKQLRLSRSHSALQHSAHTSSITHTRPSSTTTAHRDPLIHYACVQNSVLYTTLFVQYAAVLMFGGISEWPIFVLAFI